jgi:hypothetical protein
MAVAGAPTALALKLYVVSSSVWAGEVLTLVLCNPMEDKTIHSLCNLQLYSVPEGLAECSLAS